MENVIPLQPNRTGKEKSLRSETRAAGTITFVLCSAALFRGHFPPSVYYRTCVRTVLVIVRQVPEFQYLTRLTEHPGPFFLSVLLFSFLLLVLVACDAMPVLG